MAGGQGGEGGRGPWVVRGGQPGLTRVHEAGGLARIAVQPLGGRLEHGRRSVVVAAFEEDRRPRQRGVEAERIRGGGQFRKAGQGFVGTAQLLEGLGGLEAGLAEIRRIGVLADQEVEAVGGQRPVCRLERRPAARVEGVADVGALRVPLEEAVAGGDRAGPVLRFEARLHHTVGGRLGQLMVGPAGDDGVVVLRRLGRGVGGQQLGQPVVRLWQAVRLRMVVD